MLGLTILVESILILICDKAASFKYSIIPGINMLFGYYIREYRDWIDEKYPTKKKE